MKSQKNKVEISNLPNKELKVMFIISKNSGEEWINRVRSYVFNRVKKYKEAEMTNTISETKDCTKRNQQ